MSKGVKYPEGFYAWFRDNSAGRNAAQMRDLVQAVWGLDLTVAQVQCYKKNHGLPSGVSYTGTRFSVVPDDAAEYIRENCTGVSWADMVERLRVLFGVELTVTQIKTYYRGHGLKAGRDTRFKRGQVGINRGRHIAQKPGMIRTRFKPGCTPANLAEVGTLRKRGDGCLWRKVGQGQREWRPEHRLVWEAAHGPMRDGDVIVFLDGDRSNCALENLRAVPRRVSLAMSCDHLRFSDAALTETGLLISELRVKTKEKGRSNEDKE